MNNYNHPAIQLPIPDALMGNDHNGGWECFWAMKKIEEVAQNLLDLVNYKKRTANMALQYGEGYKKLMDEYVTSVIKKLKREHDDIKLILSIDNS